MPRADIPSPATDLNVEFIIGSGVAHHNAEGNGNASFNDTSMVDNA
ncbi:hypothetical protein OK016_19920 [Vibrio chagasii]|nr:hypothetical protein [Vibrio chagasii]